MVSASADCSAVVLVPIGYCAHGIMASSPTLEQTLVILLEMMYGAIVCIDKLNRTCRVDPHANTHLLAIHILTLFDHCWNVIQAVYVLTPTYQVVVLTFVISLRVPNIIEFRVDMRKCCAGVPWCCKQTLNLDTSFV